jgi:hypothetical protein
VTIIGEQVSAEMIAISYHWKPAAARADTSGRAEWAYGLRRGGSDRVPFDGWLQPSLRGLSAVWLMCHATTAHFRNAGRSKERRQRLGSFQARSPQLYRQFPASGFWSAIATRDTST